MKATLIVFSKKACQVVWEHAKAAAPMLIVFGIGAICAHAGPIVNMLNDVGTDSQTGIQSAGIGMIGWQGMRIYMDEHHSLNPGRIAGGLAGSLFAFAPESISNWAQGW